MTSQFDAKDDATKRKQTSPDSESSSTCGPQPSQSNEDASRRKFLRTAVGGAVAGLVTGAGMEFVAPSSALAQSLLTPEEALEELQEGNERFVAVNLTSFEQDLAILRHITSERQQPFAAVLACADSRVPVELIFDQTIGNIFVTRVAGNFITPEIIASLEHKTVPGQISALYPHIQPAVDKAGTVPDAVAKANALIQARLLRRSSTVISARVAAGKLLVLAAFYHIGSGKVSLLE